MIDNKYWNRILRIFNTSFIKNSFWGVFSNIVQNIFFSIFFIIVARKYNSHDFSNYILANTLYGFVLAFSSLGLGQWFIRELIIVENKQELVNKFLKIQFLIGVIFYLLNILFAFFIYLDPIIRNLSLIIGINVIFDNIIYVIKYINIAESNQSKSFVILTVEALLKFVVGCFLFVTSIPILYLAFLLIILRFITLNLFFKIGTNFKIHLNKIFTLKVDFLVIKEIVYANWSFIVIGSISVIYWRIGNIIVSKFLSISEVAKYEISFKLFSLAEVIPTIISASIFPVFINTFKTDRNAALKLYKFLFWGYAIYGFLTFSFIYSTADSLVPFLFGFKYTGVSIFCKEMFLTMLVFPTALLQANLLVAMNMEKTDMWLNIISLCINIILSIVGMMFFKSLSVINYSIFISFLVFHLIQDMILYRNKIIDIKSIILFYTVSFFVVCGYILFSLLIYPFIVFFLYWAIIILMTFYFLNRNDFFRHKLLKL